MSTTEIDCPDPSLLRDPPIFGKDMFPADMSFEEIHREVQKLFDDEPNEESGLRPIRGQKLASNFIEPAQQEIFEVPDPSGAPHPFDPYQECTGINANGYREHRLFHRTVNASKLVIMQRWSNKKGIAGNTTNQDLLKRIKQLSVRAPIQVMYVKYINRLKGNHPRRTPQALRFLYEVLTAKNLRIELPRLLHRYQPEITDRASRDPWPSPQDYRGAMEFWSCYCVHAAGYIFNHLSGPIGYLSDWLQDPALPQGVRDAFGDALIEDRADIFNDVRHQVYRQYGYAHIQAVKQGLPKFEWKRFEDPDIEGEPLGRQALQHTVLFIDQYIYRTFGTNLKPHVEVVLLNLTNQDDILEQVFDYFFHSMCARVVFWIGPDYIDQQMNGYCFVMASLCYHLTAYFGRLEQYVVLPAYNRHERKRWTNSVLATYFQRADIMPYTRVVLDPLSLELWERDGRQLAENGRFKEWDSDEADEAGYYHCEELVEIAKQNLIQCHDLDLWDHEARCEVSDTTTIPQTTPSHSDHHHTSSARGGSPAASSLNTPTPSTSTHGTHSVPGLNLDQVVAMLAQLVPEGLSPEARAKAVTDAMAYITEEALARIGRIDPEQVSRPHRPSRKDKDHESRR
ncbi:hypothetical protein AAVH_14247 [Aphelenchoides avenae]|nr:hypothetical protein AAVH_14247 [Aphelenchus avenae]